MKVIQYPDPVLDRECVLVEGISPFIVEQAQVMASTLYQYGALGLAAPQVGLLLRIVVVDVNRDPDSLIYLVNPEIVHREGSSIEKEGCLSFPGLHLSVKRAAKVSVEAHQLDGQRFRIDAEGLMARVLQHEIDHLDGKTFIRRVPPKERSKAMKKWRRR